MSRSGPLHHNRVAKNVAPSCAHSWGYTYGKRRIVTYPAFPSGPRFAETTAMHRARESRNVRDRRNHVTKRIVPSIRCRLPMGKISVGASCTRTTPTVSSVEFAAPATRSSPHERNMRRNRGPVRHVAISGRANDGASHKRPRFLSCRVRPVPRHVGPIQCERSGNRSPHAWLPVQHDSSPLVGDDIGGQRRHPPHKVSASIGIRSRLRIRITRYGRVCACAARVIVLTSQRVLRLCDKHAGASGAARDRHSFSIWCPYLVRTRRADGSSTPGAPCR